MKKDGYKEEYSNTLETIRNAEISIINYEDKWQDVNNLAMNTIGKESGKYPDSKWKMKMLKAEHSPIRMITLTVRIKNIPYWVVMHLTRHKFGIEHYVSTQRTDRTGIDRDELKQSRLVDYTFVANAQALINISRKRLCNNASTETRMLWDRVVYEINKYEPELAHCMVPECIYRGHCPEMHSCGMFDGIISNPSAKERYLDSYQSGKWGIKQNEFFATS